MTANELRRKFLDFMKSKGHTIVPSASLVPENDPTTLFTGSGMQPMIPYLLGEKHPAGNKLADSQKCFRTVDIEEVGDNRHTTFFEMLGNWSLGAYFKKEQIEMIFKFLTEEIKLDPEKIYVSVFRGNDNLKLPRDNEAVEIWKKVFSGAGIEAKDVDFSETNGMQGGKIFYYDEKKNWWSRSGVPQEMPIGEPGGPDSEMFWDLGEELKIHENSPWKNEPCHINCDCGRFLEIGNNVFMQYVKTKEGFELLKQKNIDFGGGFERILAALNNNPDIFLTDIFEESKETIEKISGKKYEDNKKAFRVILDHLRAATFLICDGVLPSNKDQGYFVRRLIRRAIRHAHELGIQNNFCTQIVEVYINYFGKHYPELSAKQKDILEELEKEENKFRKTLEQGLKEIKKMNIVGDPTSLHGNLGKLAFYFFETYGMPLEMYMEELSVVGIAHDEVVMKKEFEEELKKHQELSRTASAGMFRGGLADASMETTKLHTAAHLMLAALRKVVSVDITQKGSNITAERLRFDFNYPQKLTPEQIKNVEDLVNEQIEKKMPVSCEELKLDDAKAKGAMGVFDSKYGDKVKVYTIGEGEDIFSCEICGGPHVKNIGELGHFKITKEESSSAGVRRIKAILE